MSQGQTAGEWQSWGAPSPRLPAQGSSSWFPGSLGSNGICSVTGLAAFSLWGTKGTQ